MPFGLCNALAAFQSRINNILRPYLDIFYMAYIDNILIYSDTLEDHCQHMKLVLESLWGTGLQLKIKRCEFEVTEVKYLGMIISTTGVKMDPEKVQCITDWESPRNIKDVDSNPQVGRWSAHSTNTNSLAFATTIAFATIIDIITIVIANIFAMLVFTAVNILCLLDFSSAFAAGNSGNPPPPNKPIGLRAQCDEEGAGLESTGEFVVIATTTRKRKRNQFPTVNSVVSAPPLSCHHWHPLRALQPFLNELVAVMAVLPEGTAHALRLLNAHQSYRRHENIKFNKRRPIEEMGSEASLDGEDGLGTAGEE
ncbi:reverse transcriptase domain protein [Lasallia pustulata]|uniref:Reverse transcriptase domain protein n=1 Tax=Lasallia pustulata TaxID=136370 RepID=A0A1W5CVP2_9LECA|nr:reverse transcriptase domain protein [Lasallia pustulata]